LPANKLLHEERGFVMDGYATYDAIGLAELIRSGEVKRAELLEAARTRAAEVNPLINAIVADVDPAVPSRAAMRPFSVCRSS
jgi:Asp-tRNA(Asn)/Glu-tRNA(Gln) amidotransferase A subunit family amidase